MHKTTLRFMLIFSALVLSACTSTGGAQTAQDASAAKVIAQSDMAKVIIVRGKKLKLIYPANIEVDGQRIGRLKKNQYLEANIPPGDHKISVTYAKALMIRDAVYNVNLVAGETHGWELVSPDFGTYLARPDLVTFDPSIDPDKFDTLKKAKAKVFNTN